MHVLSEPPMPEAAERSLDARRPPQGVIREGRPLRQLLAAAAVGAAAVILVLAAWNAREPNLEMISEAVGDHLRILYSDHPLDVASGGMHQVKPWFEGRLDFAPTVDFMGDDDFPLQGGALSYFVDRKAATFVFERRLHVMTLLVFRADGLHWPTTALRAFGRSSGTMRTMRGFHVALWRGGDLGYALVSDANEDDVVSLAEKIVGQ